MQNSSESDYEGVSKSFRNHPNVKEPESLFVKSLCIVTTFTDYLLTVHRNYTIGHKIGDFKVDQTLVCGQSMNSRRNV